MDKKKIVRIAMIVAVIVALGLTALGVFYSHFETVHLRVRLLCKTDHAALLAACEQLSEWVTDGTLDPGTYRFRPWFLRAPAVARFPEPIRKLRPVYIVLDDSRRVTLEMFGGLSYFGVHAYPSDYNAPPGIVYGDRELIPNLWYYDDEYHKDPRFDEIIDAILEKCDKGVV